MKLNPIIILAFGLLIIMPAVVLAAFDDVTLSSGDTLRVVVGSTTVDLSVDSGKIEAVTVNAANMLVTMAAGSSLNVTSSTKRNITYAKTNATASFTCGESSSVLTFSLGAGQAVEIVTITPSDSACVAPSQGGGGGSSQTTTPAPTPTPTPTPAPTTTTTTSSAPTTTTTTQPTTPTVTAPVTSTPTVSAPAPVVSMVPVLMSELNPGVRNDEVMDLQKLLAQDPTIYPEGTVSGFYGPKTTAAVKKFQARYGLPTVGRVGPATLAKLNEVFGETTTTTVQPIVSSVAAQTADQIQLQIQAIQQQIGALTSGSAAAVSSAVGVSVSSELDPGARNDEVMDLQKLLAQDPTIYPDGTVSGFYGPKTTAAVKKFQAKYGLPTVGRVGPATMQKINEVLGGSSSSMPVVPQTPSYVAPTAPVSSSSSESDATKQIEEQIKAIQAQIQALLGQ